MAHEIEYEIDVLLCELGPEARPDSTTHRIGEVCFGAHPGGGDYRTYILETGLSGAEFSLWIEAIDDWSDVEYDDDGEERSRAPWYALQARMTTTDDLPVKDIAARLIEATWEHELASEIWGTDFESFSVDSGGILDADEIRQIAGRVGRRET